MKRQVLKRIISVLIIIMILVNTLPNFGLLRNISYAAEPSDSKKGIIIKPGLSDFEIMSDGTKMYKLNIYMKDVESAGGVINFTYDNTKLAPAKYTETDLSAMGMGIIKQLTESSVITEVATFSNMIDNAYDPSTIDTENSDIYISFIETDSIPIKAEGELLVCSINFKVKDNSLKFSDIKESDFTINMEYSYINVDTDGDGNGEELQEGYLFTDGFNTATTPVVTGITISTEPKKDYVVGETLDLNDMVVTATYSDTTTKELTDSEYTTNANELDLTTPGTKTLTVTYEGTDIAEGADKPTVNLDINVREKKVTKLEFSGFQDSYKLGDEVDLSDTNIWVMATYEGETTPEKLDSKYYTLSATGNSIVGNKITLTNSGTTTITATLKDKEAVDGLQPATHTITIAEKTLERIEVTGPTTDVYTVRENLDLSGMTVTAIYGNGYDPETITEGYTTSINNGDELTAPGVQTVTVTYQGKEDTFDIVVFPTKLVGTEENDLSTVSVEGFIWENGSAKITVGENEYTLKYTNTDPAKVKTCNVKVLGIPANLTATYGDTLADVKYNGTAGLPTGFAWANSTTSVGNVGDQRHSITYAGYTGLQAKVTVNRKTLTKADLTYTMPAERPYDGTTATTVSVTAPTGAGTVTVKYYKDGENTTTATEDKPVNAGTYKVLVTVTEGDNYTELTETELDGSFTIKKADLKDTDFDLNGMPENNTKEYDGTSLTVTSKIKDTVPGAGDIREAVTVKCYDEEGNEVENPSDYGTYTVKVSVVEGDNYNAVNDLEIDTFSITGTTLKDTDIEYTEPDNLEYDGEVKTATVEIPEKAGDLTITYWQGTTNVPNPTDAGTYTVKITTTGGDNFVAVTDKQVGTFTITQRPVTVTIANKTSVYGQGLETLTSDVTSGTVVAGDDLGVTLTKAPGTDAKEYAITGNATNTNYDVTFVDGTYTITPKPITVTIQDATSVYGQPIAELTCTTNDGLVGTDSLEAIVDLSTTATTTSDVGTYDITGTIKNNNYDVTFTNEDDTSNKGTYDITRATLTSGDFIIEGLPNGSIKYGTTVNVTATPNVNGVGDTREIKFYKVNEDGSVSTTEVIGQPLPYGMYKVKLNVSEGKNYFAAEIDLGTFTVSKEELPDEKVNFTNKEEEYDGTSKSVTITITDDSSAVITNVTYYKDGETTGTTTPIDAGTYRITADIASGKYGNISGREIGEFTITPREITVEIGNIESAYGEGLEGKTIAVNVTSEKQLADRDTIDKVVAVEIGEAKNVGEYPIKGKTINDNYNVTFANDGTYEITAKPIKVTIGKTGSVYGETEATLDNSLITLEDGTVLPYNETISDLRITLSREEGTDVGTYAITGESTNGNYNIEYVDGEYEITKATLVADNFDISGMPENNKKAYNGQEVIVTAEIKEGIIGAGDTLIVKYYDEAGNEATNTSDYGTYVVKVNINEGDNYFAADGSEEKPEIEIGRFTIDKNKLSAGDIELTPPNPNVYDGTPKNPTVDPKVEGVGDITVIIKDEDGNIVENPTDAGEYTVEITTENATNYDDVKDPMPIGKFTIEKAEPTYEIPTGLTATYGETLADVELPEGFTWQESGTVGDAGTRTHTVKYTPTDSNYKEVTGIEVEVEVAKADPEYNLGELEATYGETLADVELPEGFTWNDTDTTSVGNAGPHTFKVTFTPNDTTNYNTLTNIDATINVKKKRPTFTVPTGLEGYEGQPLSSIDITSNTGFSWTDATTTLPLIKDNGETFNTTMTYTPADTDNFEIVENISVEIKVKENEIKAIRVSSTKADGSNPEYYEGQTFDRDDILVEAQWAIGGWQTVTDYTIVDEARSLTTSDTKMVINYAEKTAEQAITVKADEIDAITFNFNGEPTYNYGDAIDLGTSTVTRTWKSGLTHENDTMQMTLDMLQNTDITDFTKMEVLGTKNITVTAFGKTASNTFQIEVEDAIENITIVDKTILEKDYNYNQPIDVTGGQISINYKSGHTETENITTSMLSGYSMTTVKDNQIVTVTYTNDKGKKYTDTFTINVKDVVIGIDITKEPTKKLYKLNESQSFGDIEVTNVMASGNAGTKLTAGEYTISVLDTTTPGEKTITVTKNGTTYTDTFKVKVIDVTTDMFISDLPKVNYKYGEGLSLVGGTITVKTQANTTGTVIPMTNSSVTVTGYNPNELGDQELTVTYTYTEETETGIETKTKTDKYSVKVEDYETGIKVTPPTKTAYDYGMPIDLTGATVSKVWASGKTTDLTEISGGMISEYSATTVGTQTIYVNAFGKQNVGSFIVTVVDNTIGISMKELPNKIEYTQGETIDVTGAVLNVTKQSGIKEVPITKEMISGYDPNKTGAQVITVTYDGKQTQFPIIVKEKPKKPVTPTKPNRPTPPTPNKPSTNDTVKYTVTFVDYNGTVLKEEVVESGKGATAPEVETRDGYKFKGWDKEFDSVEEDIKVTAKYEKVVRAEVNTPGNMEVEQGGDIDLSDVTLTIRDEDGNEIDEIPVTEDMISEFNPEKIGTQTVTVTYTDEEGFEYTATFRVKVKASKPAEVLGVKDEVKDNNDLNKMILPLGIGAGATGLLLILLALLTRKNVEIYALTENGRKLVGRDKISKNNARIVLDEYEKQLEDANIEIVLNKKITKKLDNETVSIVFNGRKATYKVTYEDNEEFIIRIKNI